MTNVAIHLEPNHEGRFVYYPNQLLKGTVELSLDRVRTFRGFYVKVCGNAKAHWTEQRTRETGTGENKRTETYTVYFEGNDTYLNSRTYFFGERGGSSLEIQPGIHRYSFACQLPDQLPYTLDMRHGEIRYYVQAVLDIPWSFDKEIIVSFTVARFDDLNLYRELRLAQKQEEVKTFCCFCCKSDPLFITATIPCSGFAVDQNIPVSIDYVNKSDVDVERTIITLSRTVTYTSDTPERKSRYDTERMVEVIAAGIKSSNSTSIKTNLRIPSVMMNSNDKFCRVVKITYSIHIVAEVDGCHSNPEIYLPITIGSVPINFDNQYIAPSIPMVEPIAPYIPVEPIAPIIPMVQPSAPSEEQFNDLPPSFDEAMLMAKPENSALLQGQSTSNVGWNVSAPSAPVQEKQ